MEVPIIEEIVIIFALSIGVLLFCHRLKLPAVVGFLVTGILCGPHGLGLVSAISDVQMLATVGIVLLLFTVGMEFSIQKIIKYKYYFFVGGCIQVFATVLACFCVSKFFYDSAWGSALFLGFLISLSSTAIVLRALDEKGESDTPHGRLILGILIFQDIVAVPMMLLIPVLSGAGEGFETAHLFAFAKGITILVFMSAIAFKVVPLLLYYVTLTRNRELFLLTVLTVCFAIAWITSSAGLSLSLGAFLAGLIVSESEYSDEAIGNVLPFQEIFTSFFFVSMGMLLDIGFVVQQPLFIVALTLLVIVLKSAIAGGGALALGMPLRSAVLSGVALCQVGEFSFVLALSGIEYELATEYYYQLFLAVSLLTMAVTPTLMVLSQWFVRLLEMLPIPQKILTGYNYTPENADHHNKRDHIIIIGFGVRGRHLARVAKATGIPYLILEMNSETVKIEKGKGEPIHFGDASHHSILSHSGIRDARAIAVVINDPMASLRIVKVAREMNPKVYIISRTRYFQEVAPMFQLGADDVIPDEFGSSLEIFSRLLEKCAVPQHEVAKLVYEVRVEGYHALHWQDRESASAEDKQFDLKGTFIRTFQVMEGSALSGKTIIGSELRRKYGLTILQIKRSGETLISIDPEMTIQTGDVLVLVGTPEQLELSEKLFKPVYEDNGEVPAYPLRTP